MNIQGLLPCRCPEGIQEELGASQASGCRAGPTAEWGCRACTAIHTCAPAEQRRCCVPRLRQAEGGPGLGHRSHTGQHHASLGNCGCKATLITATSHANHAKELSRKQSGLHNVCAQLICVQHKQPSQPCCLFLCFALIAAVVSCTLPSHVLTLRSAFSVGTSLKMSEQDYTFRQWKNLVPMMPSTHYGIPA